MHAMEEFERIVKDEEERIEAIAEKENERVVEFLRENEQDVSCPLCLEDLQAITPIEKGCTVMICCGTRLCKDCSSDWAQRQHTTTILDSFQRYIHEPQTRITASST